MGNDAHTASTDRWTSKPADRISFIEEYEAHISQLKLAAMQSATFAQLSKVAQVFILSQEYYMVLFKMLFNAILI